MGDSHRNSNVGIPRGWRVIRVDTNDQANRVAAMMRFEKWLIVSRVVWLVFAVFVAAWIVAVEYHLATLPTADNIIDAAIRRATDG